MVREKLESPNSFKSNKDDFPILISFGGLSPNISPTASFPVLPLDLLPPQPPKFGVRKDTERGGNSCFVVVYLAFGVTQLFIVE